MQFSSQFSLSVQYSGRLNKSPLILNIMSARKPPRSISPLYARYFTSEEKKSLRAVPVNDLAGEINLVRVISAHYMEFQQSAPTDMGARIQSLRTSFILGEQFAKLIRAHIQEHDPRNEFYDVMEQAWREIRKEMGID